MKLSVFWFRRDLRLEDNTALSAALKSGFPVLPLFIFDKNILHELPASDARVSFIYKSLAGINKKLEQVGSSLLCLWGDPVKVWAELLTRYEIQSVYTNKDYEPYALNRDESVRKLLFKHAIEFHAFKDQVIFEEDEILKSDKSPYLVFTPYKKQWVSSFGLINVKPEPTCRSESFFQHHVSFPTLTDIGFTQSEIEVPEFDLSVLKQYTALRNFPSEPTSYLGPHLRFGTVSIRQVIERLAPSDETFMSELIWREFFMMILYHFPHVIDTNFQTKYNGIQWRNDSDEFEKWCNGLTGYPLVDAGMRQLNETGFMHNRVRMVTAGFLCKHLLIDWRWGEAYFAQKLLDYELSSNNGNWQWAAGTGCDAAPYFRIFNPTEQLKKFDKSLAYVSKWLPEFGASSYPEPIVEHKYARERALLVYKRALAEKVR